MRALQLTLDMSQLFGTERPGPYGCCWRSAALHEKTIQKDTGGERGWRAALQLEEFGASDATDNADECRMWLAENVRALARPVRYRGNHKYA